MKNGSESAMFNGTHNLTEQCGWLSEDNRTMARTVLQLDAAECLFLFILPHECLVNVLICVIGFLILFSLLANGLTLFGIKQSEDPSCEPRMGLLRNLILSDLIQTFTFGPSTIHLLIQHRTMAFSVWCNLQYFVGTISIFASLVTITLMTLERYLYVCHAMNYMVIVTQRRLRVSLILIWVYSFSISIVGFVMLHISTVQKNEQVTKGLLCEPDTVEQHMGFPRASAVFRQIAGCFTLLTCLVVYAFSYLMMYKSARNAVMPFHATNTTARKTVMFYCGMLFLQLLPLLLKVVSDVVWEVDGTMATAQDAQVKTSRSASAGVLHLCLLVMLVVPPCINPLVYGFRSAEIRKMMTNLFKWSTEMWCAAVECCGRVERIRNLVHPIPAQAG